MQHDPSQRVLLEAFAREAFIPVVSSFVEKASLALGLAPSEALALTLASEEVFGHLCRVVLPLGGTVKVECSGGVYYVRLDFTFPAADLDMRAFNITASVSASDEADMEQMGLFLASRFVDRFSMAGEEGSGLKLSLIKEKAYHAVEPPSTAPIRSLEKYSVRAPDSEELKLFSHLVKATYGNCLLPDVFSTPGKLVDMVAGGEYHAAVAVGPSGEIGGGTLWCRTGSRAVEWFGPYLFNQESRFGMANALLDRCLEAIAKSSAVVLINRFPTPELPREQFEHLGNILTCKADGTCSRREAWARLMHEDAGCVAWAHEKIRDFLRDQYRRLVLPRDVRLVENMGENRSPHSVLLTTFDRQQASVTMSPIWLGQDFEDNLRHHLTLFRREEIRDVFFSMDLGRSWEAELTPGLLRNGFKACFVLPYAGMGDLLLFQLQESAP